MPSEIDLQDHIAKKLEELGWEVEEWDIGVKGDRSSLSDIILTRRFFDAIERINKITLTDKEKERILSNLLILPNSIEGIKIFLDYVRNGIPITLERENKEIAKQIFLFDFENPENNDFLAVKEFEIEERGVRKRFDFCLFVNGIPLVAIETKNPFAEDEETNWFTAYKELIEYEQSVPSIFRFIQFCIATDGYTAKYFPNYYATDYSNSLASWETTYPLENVRLSRMFEQLDKTIYGMLSKQNLIDLVENFIFIKKVRDTQIKIMARWMQFTATNKIVKRVVNKEAKLGLIWHWQGSGKTLTMAFASWKLFRHSKLEQPTIFIIVDRRDLQDQLSEEFSSIGIEVEEIKSIKELVDILKWGGKEREGKRGIFICLIQKFNPKKLKELHDKGEINLKRENIVILTDESHRSHYGILASTLRGIFKNAFIFGFTGTPLTKPERNTFEKFSPKGELYIDRFGMFDSINHGFTLPIRYEARLPELHLKPKEIEELAEYEEEVLEELSPEERRIWRSKVKPRIALLKKPEKIEKVCKDIAEYFKTKIEKTGFKAMIAVVDRECCVLFKEELDKLLGEKYTEIVMTYQAKEKSDKIKEYKEKLRQKYGSKDFVDINKEIIRRFKEEEFPKIVIVSDMLLTGFDAKKLWVLFLYKPLKEHRLLQAITRTNRPYPNKEFGLVVDYIGVADYLEEALEIFETDFVREAKLFIRRLEESEKEFERIISELKGLIPTEIGIDDIDRIVEYIVLNDLENEFLEKVRRLKRLYELISPSEVVFKHVNFYKIVITVAIALSRYRRRGIRLEEIEKMSKKTYELIQKTVDVERIEKIGEIDIGNELEKLEKDARPISVMKIIAEIYPKISGRKGEFYRSIAKEIEEIYRELKEKKAVTRGMIERLKRISSRIHTREEEQKVFGEIYPVFEVLRKHSKYPKEAEKVSNEILSELKERGLLNKEDFIRESRRKAIRRVIREKIIEHFGFAEDIEEIENQIFLNLEEKYG